MSGTPTMMVISARRRYALRVMCHATLDCTTLALEWLNSLGQDRLFYEWDIDHDGDIRKEELCVCTREVS